MTDQERIVAVVTELRAQELRCALHHAVAGAPHWRLEASHLLAEIDNGELPPEPTQHGYSHDH